MGEVSLRRRLEPITGTHVYEVKLGDEFLMSSMFTIAEVALADVALGELIAVGSSNLSVLVGGLGLGYTAVAALRHTEVAQVSVIEALQPVIDWHQQGLLPASAELMDDPRTNLVLADFFAVIGRGSDNLATAGPGPDGQLDSAYDAVLLDIDHAPDFVLHNSHQGFYSQAGLQALRRWVKPGGVFALWSDNPPDVEFSAHLAAVFGSTRAEVIRFANPLTRGTSTNTVYLAFG